MVNSDVSCETKHCMGVPKLHRKKCEKCRSRKWVADNPMHAFYSKWIWHANRRGVPHSVTIEQFEVFCAFTNYLQLKGLNADDMTIDCLDNYVGYVFGMPTYSTIGKWSGWVFGNIRMIPRSQNSKEGKKGKNPAYQRQPGDPF